MNATRQLLGRSVSFGSVVALAALSLLSPALAAQDDDAEVHPAHIHAGTCAELGDVVVPLTDITVFGDDAERTGAASSIPVENNLTIVEMPLQEIIDGGHAINVHLSAEDIGTYIACGDIGGVVTPDEGEEDSELIIGLGELNESGHTGIAWLGAAGDTTRVQVSLIESGAMEAGAEAAQEATPAAATTGADAAESLAVEIKGFAYNPPVVEVPVGGSVTWTNQDNAPHTATGIDREVLQSGAIAFDASYTQTFDTAGTFEYFCEFHPNMKGSVVVE